MCGPQHGVLSSLAVAAIIMTVVCLSAVATWTKHLVVRRDRPGANQSRGERQHVVTDENRSGQRQDRDTVFQARQINKVYHVGEVDVHALRGVDLDLRAGEFMVLLGPSGSGKSTLLNILGGLDVPTSGTVRYLNHELTAFDDTALTRFRREHVGFVFQFYNLIPSLTARENVALITEISRNPLDPREALDLVGMSHRMDHFPSQLSGGEQQRTAIARAIAKRPDVLLCDEPTGALDVHTGVVVLEAIERINRELGTTTAVITHNAVIGRMADRIVHLSDGRVTHMEENELQSSRQRIAVVSERESTKPQGNSRSVGHQGPGVCDCPGDRLGCRHVRDVAQHAAFAAAVA